MKKLILCFTLTFSSLFSFAQYEPLVVEDAHWRCGVPALGFSVFQDFIMRGDTVVDGQTYKKVYYCQCGYLGDTLFALVREDISTQKVYNILLRDECENDFSGKPDLVADSCALNIEHELFDYSLETGDTLDRYCWMRHPLATIQYCIVIGIDTFPVIDWQASSEREVFSVQCEILWENGNTYNTWAWFYEGIGSDSGPLLPDILAPRDLIYGYDVLPGLSCEETGPTDNWAINNVFTSNNIKAFPSPVKNILHIEADNYVAKGSYKLSTIAGQIIKDGKFSGHRTEVTVNELSAGIYFIQIFDKTQLLAVGKVLVK